MLQPAEFMLNIWRRNHTGTAEKKTPGMWDLFLHKQKEMLVT
jgi:hypothetical protein